MVQPRGLDLDAFAHGQASVLDVVEITLRLHLVKVDGKIRRSHLLGKHLLEAAGLGGGVEGELTVGTVVQGPEKWHALNVVPVEMRNKNMRGKRPVGELAFEFVPQYAEAGAAIEDVDLISQTHFDAGGIAPIAQVLGLWSGRGAAYAPKLNSHKFRCFLIPFF